jgi:elongation factor G
MRGNANVVNAMVPLANMFGYVSNLRSMSQGRATFHAVRSLRAGSLGSGCEIQREFA